MDQSTKDKSRLAPTWLNQRDGGANLVASRHRGTGQHVFPRLPEHSPAAPAYEPVMLSAHARLYSFTVIHPNPKSGQAPFALVYADFPEGVRVFGRLRLPEGAQPVIGTRLEVVMETSPDGEAHYHFVPAQEELQ